MPKTHRSVTTVLKFEGWERLKEIEERAMTLFGIREAALVDALFIGGFRISEAVKSHHGGLKPGNIVVIEGKNVLRFVDVSVMKKYRKIAGSGYLCHEIGPHKGRAIWDADHKHFDTQRRVGQDIIRNCSAPLFEPLVANLRAYTRESPSDAYLFDFSRFKAYRVIEKIDPSIWPHWFRSQRASQLGERFQNGGYEWNKTDLKDWFKWTSEDTASVYAHDEASERLEGKFPDRLL
jgi:hypothetical protein